MAITPIFMRSNPLKAGRSGGFTLLEVLMVVLIVGILTAVVVLSLNFDQGPSLVNKTAETIANQLALVEDEAIARQEIWGVRIDSQRLSFRRMDTVKQQWVRAKRVMLQSDMLLPDGVELKVLQTTSQAAGGLPLQGAANPLTMSEDFQPDIYILPTGQVTPVTLSVSASGGAYAHYVALNTLGSIEVRDTEKPADPVPSSGPQDTTP